MSGLSSVLCVQALVVDPQGSSLCISRAASLLETLQGLGVADKVKRAKREGMLLRQK